MGQAVSNTLKSSLGWMSHLTASASLGVLSRHPHTLPLSLPYPDALLKKGEDEPDA
jgi:hypothetical protein